MATPLADIAELIGGDLRGDSGDLLVSDIAEILHAQPDQISFVGNPRYYKYLDSTSAGAVVLPSDYQGDFAPRIEVENPQLAVSQLIDHFRPPSKPDFQGIHETAHIHPSAHLGENVSIGPYATIGAGSSVGDNTRLFDHVSIGQECTVGEDTRIYPHVTVYERSVIGDRVIIHSGTVIGSDGYGFTYHEGEHRKIRQVGIVRIGDDVEIGSNCSIDRATLGETVIGSGSKLDNLIQIGHNVKLGRGCLIVSQVGISGSTKFGDFVSVGGQAGIIGHIEVGDQVRIASKAGVTKDIEAKQTVSGFPALPHREAQKEKAYIRRLPDLEKRIRALEEALNTKESRE